MKSKVLKTLFVLSVFAMLLWGITALLHDLSLSPQDLKVEKACRDGRADICEMYYCDVDGFTAQCANSLRKAGREVGVDWYESRPVFKRDETVISIVEVRCVGRGTVMLRCNGHGTERQCTNNTIRPPEPEPEPALASFAIAADRICKPLPKREGIFGRY
jgi:hypothetical protein